MIRIDNNLSTGLRVLVHILYVSVDDLIDYHQEAIKFNDTNRMWHIPQRIFQSIWSA